MHDPFLKSVLADHRMIEILIRDHVPEWADAIDFSTLRKEPTALVSKKTLQRRHPDMIWSADTTDAGTVVFLIEFQRQADWLMALRTTTYTALALEGIAAEAGPRATDALPEFVYLVLYRGDGQWSGPDHVTDLFRRSDPGRFRLVSWREGETAGRPRDDITALVLGLARSLSLEEMAAQVAALRLAVEEHGDPGLDAFMAERMDTMLELRDYPEELQLGGAKTMTEMVERFHRSLDELVQRGAREGRRQGRQQGRRQGRRQGQAMVLRRQIARRFGEETAGKVSEILEALPGTDDIDRVTDALFECGTGEEFIKRVRTA